jgi:hypothetical protein
MGKAYTLDKKAKCGGCKNPIREGDLFTIIYADDGSGKIEHLLCDNCEVDDRIQEYRDNGIVSSKLATEAAMAHYYLNESNDPNLYHLREEARHYYLKYKKDLLEIAEGNKKIGSAITEFEKKHWLPYIKKYWNDASMRGHEAKIDGMKVMMWGSAGRVLITIQKGEHDVTMIFSDYEKQTTPNGGQQGINAPVSVALDMIEAATKVNKIKFKVEKKVRLAGL